MRGVDAAARRGERGILSTELALLMPVLVVFALVAVHAVHVQQHQTRARSAADAAARAAALHGAPGLAVQQSVQEAAERQCSGSVSEVGLSWVLPDETALRPGHVAAEVTCTERFGGIAAMVGAGERSVTTRSVSVLEYWRAP